MKRRQITYGFALPILWGLGKGWSVAQIAEGLGIRQCTVIEAVECFGPRWLATGIRDAWKGMYPDDEEVQAPWPWQDDDGHGPRPPHLQQVVQQEWAEANWLRARLGAGAILDDMGEM